MLSLNTQINGKGEYNFKSAVTKKNIYIELVLSNNTLSSVTLYHRES